MRILLFILSLFFCVTIDAQKLAVESFDENTRDLAARTEQRVDNNGVPCALIKVWLASPGALFEGNVMGDVTYKTSEYWVYMPKGSKRLLVKLEGYLPLPVEFQPLESNITYVLTISGITGNVKKEEGEKEVATVTVRPDDHEYVDLGLSVKWAKCNVGASQPWEYGDYYAWGETKTKSNYGWLSYMFCRAYSDYKMTKYCRKSRYGTVDKKTQLDPQDDVAQVKWGDSWRMPTEAEQDELREKCKWSWTTQNGVKGYKVTSKKNGNSIFLPAAGYRYDSSLYYAGSYGSYWSSSLIEDYSYYAYGLNFNSSGVVRSSNVRGYGQSVRPVCP